MHSIGCIHLVALKWVQLVQFTWVHAIGSIYLGASDCVHSLVFITLGPFTRVHSRGCIHMATCTWLNSLGVFTCVCSICYIHFGAFTQVYSVSCISLGAFYWLHGYSHLG